MSSIIIYSAPIHSGKTTRLANWLKKKNTRFGFLTPDVAGLRKIHLLEDDKIVDFQMEGNPLEAHIKVGKYVFSTAGFTLAQNTLNTFSEKPEGIFVIDEIGKLELQNKGLEPALFHALTEFNTRKDASLLILVVRDYLLEEVLDKYPLGAAQIVSHTYFELDD